MKIRAQWFRRRGHQWVVSMSSSTIGMARIVSLGCQGTSTGVGSWRKRLQDRAIVFGNPHTDWIHFFLSSTLQVADSTRTRFGVLRSTGFLYSLLPLLPNVALRCNENSNKLTCTRWNYFRDSRTYYVFLQYFVVGADAYLTYNLNPFLGLANGTPMKLHSLSF